MSRNAGGAVAHGPFFAVVTADLVGSRQLADRAEAQRRLSHLVKHLNRTMRKHLAVPFMITLGDEVQGLFGDITRVSEAVIRIHEIFHPKEITVGIGVGTLATRLARRVTEMDGPAFIRSRSAVELAKKKRREVIVETGDRRGGGPAAWRSQAVGQQVAAEHASGAHPGDRGAAPRYLRFDWDWLTTDAR